LRIWPLPIYDWSFGYFYENGYGWVYDYDWWLAYGLRCASHVLIGVLER
jgi:hypothetical protein